MESFTPHSPQFLAKRAADAELCKSINFKRRIIYKPSFLNVSFMSYFKISSLEKISSQVPISTMTTLFFSFLQISSFLYSICETIFPPTIYPYIEILREHPLHLFFLFISHSSVTQPEEEDYVVTDGKKDFHISKSKSELKPLFRQSPITSDVKLRLRRGHTQMNFATCHL